MFWTLSWACQMFQELVFSSQSQSIPASTKIFILHLCVCLFFSLLNHITCVASTISFPHRDQLSNYLILSAERCCFISPLATLPLLIQMENMQAGNYIKPQMSIGSRWTSLLDVSNVKSKIQTVADKNTGRVSQCHCCPQSDNDPSENKLNSQQKDFVCICLLWTKIKESVLHTFVEMETASSFPASSLGGTS